VIENKVLQHDETVIELKDHDITIERFFYHTKAEIVITLKQKTCDKQRFEKECLLVYDDVLDSFGLVVPPESLVKIPEDKRPTSLFEETPRKFM
jgi:hypothetical protein